MPPRSVSAVHGGTTHAAYEHSQPPEPRAHTPTTSYHPSVLSRILYGARISLTIGLLGISISFALGLIIGVLAGSYGGLVDMTVQRVIAIIRSFPEFPLLMALSAVHPVTWNADIIYFWITAFLVLLD